MNEVPSVNLTTDMDLIVMIVAQRNSPQQTSRIITGEGTGTTVEKEIFKNRQVQVRFLL